MMEEERMRQWSRPREDLELDDLQVCTTFHILNYSDKCHCYC